MKITTKVTIVLIILIIFLSLSIPVYGEIKTKSYFYNSPLDQTYLFKNPQLQSLFDNNIKSDQFLLESSSNPLASEYRSIFNINILKNRA